MKWIEVDSSDKLNIVKIVEMGWSRLKWVEAGWGWYFRIDPWKEQGLIVVNTIATKKKGYKLFELMHVLKCLKKPFIDLNRYGFLDIHKQYDIHRSSKVEGNLRRTPEWSSKWGYLEGEMFKRRIVSYIIIVIILDETT